MARELSDTKLNVNLRRRKVWELRRFGFDYDEIADKLRDDYGEDSLPPKYNGRSAYEDISTLLRQFDNELRETAQEVAWIELDRFDELLAGIWERAREGDLAAVSKALEISRERRKLLGIDNDSLKVDWRIELVELLDSGKLRPEEIVAEFGEEVLAQVLKAKDENG